MNIALSSDGFISWHTKPLGLFNEIHLAVLISTIHLWQASAKLSKGYQKKPVFREHKKK